MKIEICEQMIQSWLQNIEQCEIVQTNWTISPLRDIDPTQIAEVERLMKSIQDDLNKTLDPEDINALQEAANLDAEEISFDEDDLNRTKSSTKVKKLNIFKKSKPEQFIRQCEIDVVGAKFCDGVAERIYLADSAFHKSGLGYHDPVATVVKKITRAALVSAIIFGTGVPISIVFAAPKCGATLKAKIDPVVKIVRNILAADYPNISVDVYFNGDFATKIYLPLKNNIGKLNNDNDLFMRALNLAAVAEGNLPVAGPGAPAAPSVPTSGSSTSSSPVKTPRGYNEKFVFGILTDMVKTGKMTPIVLDDLQKPPFAKANFKLSSYPVLLKESAFPYSSFDRCRFYKKALTVSGEKFLVCSQWYTERLALFEAWYKAL